MTYDAIIIGAGLSGLTAASLLSKRGLKTLVLEHSGNPGGSCGIFKRDGVIFDQAAAMLYGFGEEGFNSHRFLFNALEEPFEVIRHDLLYVVCFQGHRIRFYPDLSRFIEELSTVFPSQAKNIRRFYTDMHTCYRHVISETPSYTTPDESDPFSSFKNVMRHPFSYIRFLSYLNQSAENLLKKYFTDPDILLFFNKLTSTYCYATVKEAPAILASVMFIDNHVGGSYYPAGSTLFLPGKLEKAIEENGGDIRYDSTVLKILTEHEKAVGVLLENGDSIYGKNIIYSGTVWNLYQKLLSSQTLVQKEIIFQEQIPTYSSIVLYALVSASVITPDSCPIEMLAANPDRIDESEITLYILSLDDTTLCKEGTHTVVAIGPTFRDWNCLSLETYSQWKEEETGRILSVLENRFPGFKQNLLHCELATPKTIEHYTMKNNGAAAGPKQMLGQHMLLRQPIRSRFPNLFVCGDSTTMGTGTPTVTTSGIAAANAVLKKEGMDPFLYRPGRKEYVKILPHPLQKDWIDHCYPRETAILMHLASKCLYCTHPSCVSKEILNIPGILRRISCANFYGAAKECRKTSQSLTDDFLSECEKHCIQVNSPQGSVPITRIIKELLSTPLCHHLASPEKENKQM